ncbi:Protein MAIN-LIKE 2 [Linum perenne]
MFDRLPAGAPADVVIRYARAYTWVLLGAILLADRTGDLIPVHLLRLIGDSRVASTFSWGSAVLAWLYKAMGRAAFFTAGSQRGTGQGSGGGRKLELVSVGEGPKRGTGLGVGGRDQRAGEPPLLPPLATPTILEFCRHRFRSTSLILHFRSSNSLDSNPTTGGR